jgi:hypothetical protein
MPKHSHACTRGIDLLPDAIYVVSDDGVYTSAGVSSGIDLALALVESDHGPDLARALHATAGRAVPILRAVAGAGATPPALRAVIEAACADPGRTTPSISLAAVAMVSRAISAGSSPRSCMLGLANSSSRCASNPESPYLTPATT